MVPADIVWIDALPLTPSGKIDSSALPEPIDEARDAFIAPRTTFEETLAAIWSEVLGRAPIGVRDHFFDLGGHSLSALQVTALVRARLRVDLPLRAVFDRPVLAEMAAFIATLAVNRNRVLEAV